MSRQSDDLLAKFRFREYALMALIAINAVLANLPHAYVEETLHLNYNYLIAGLACTVVVALFLYLKFLYLIAVFLLILGANVPDQIAEQLGISKLPLILALALMAGISLINHLVRMMPTGLELKPRQKSAEGIRAMFYGIDKDNVAYARKVLRMRFDPNLRHENGLTPLAFAAMKGNPQMVALLLRNGADVSVAAADGDTPVELALQMGHIEIANQLKLARVEQEARASGAVLAAA